MDRIEHRFLIYEGFQNEASLIFRKFIEKFDFKILDVSEYGIHFTNNRCNLDLTYESGIQLWLKLPKYNISEMIPKLCMFKGDNVYNKYREIAMKDSSKEQINELSEFLIDYFSEELNPNNEDI
jgi:hypothetical protein